MVLDSDCLRAMAEVGWADGVVTAKERADFELVARLLDLPAADVGTALSAAQVSDGTSTARAVEKFAAAGLVLRPGDRVAFHRRHEGGAVRVGRRTRAAGLQPAGVAKTTNILVAADPNSLSGKASKAQAYGIAIVTEDAFERLLAG